MKRKIKLLLTIPNFDTAGSGKSVYDTIVGLDKNDYDIEVAVFHTKGDLYKEIEKLGVKIHVFQFNAAYKPFFSLPFRVLKIFKFFKSHQFDIIHSWHWSSDFTEPLAAKMAGIPFIYTKKAMGWGNKAWSWRSKLSSRIVVVNSEMKDLYFHGMFEKVIQIPLCVDVNRFHAQDKLMVSPEDVKINDNDFAIVTVANMVPVKGIELLIEAVLALQKDNIKLFIVGDYDNDYGYNLKSKYHDGSHVYFTGKKLDVRPYLALCDLFVIPTKDEGRREGLPIAPMEAMSSSRIVVGSNITGIKEVLKAFPECLFEPDSIDDIKTSLEKIMNMSQEERSILAKKMRAYVKRELSITKFIDEHNKLYKETVKT